MRLWTAESGFESLPPSQAKFPAHKSLVFSSFRDTWRRSASLPGRDGSGEQRAVNTSVVIPIPRASLRRSLAQALAKVDVGARIFGSFARRERAESRDLDRPVTLEEERLKG